MPGQGGRLKGMAAGFVKNDAAKAVVDNHRHRAGWAKIGFKHGNGLAGRVGREVFDGQVFKKLITAAGPRRKMAGLLFCRRRGDGLQRKPAVDPLVFNQQACRIGNQDPGFPFGQAAAGLADQRVRGKSGGAGRFQQVDFADFVDARRAQQDRVALQKIQTDQRRGVLQALVVQGGRRLARQLDQVVLGKILGDGVKAQRPFEQAQAKAVVQPGQGFFQAPVDHGQLAAPGLLAKNLGKIGAGRQGQFQQILDQITAKHG